MSLFLQVTGVLSSLLIVLLVLFMIRSRRLTEEYATLWLCSSALLLIGSIFAERIFLFYARLKGASGSGLGILLFLVVMFILALLVVLTSKISIHQQQIKNITQKLALLESGSETSREQK